MYGYTESAGEVTSGAANVTVANLATMLGLMNTITFTVSLLSTTDTNTYRIAEPWIKMLLQNPTLVDTSTLTMLTLLQTLSLCRCKGMI